MEFSESSLNAFVSLSINVVWVDFCLSVGGNNNASGHKM